MGSPPELWYRGVRSSKLTADVNSRVTDPKFVAHVFKVLPTTPNGGLRAWKPKLMEMHFTSYNNVFHQNE